MAKSAFKMKNTRSPANWTYIRKGKATVLHLEHGAEN